MHDAARVNGVDALRNVAGDAERVDGLSARRARLVRLNLVPIAVFFPQRIVQAHIAALQRQVDELAVLLQGKAPHDVWVLVAVDEHLDLLLRQLNQLLKHPLDGHLATVHDPVVHHRPARPVSQHRLGDLEPANLGVPVWQLDRHLLAGYGALAPRLSREIRDRHENRDGRRRRHDDEVDVCGRRLRNGVPSGVNLSHAIVPGAVIHRPTLVQHVITVALGQEQQPRLRRVAHQRIEPDGNPAHPVPVLARFARHLAHFQRYISLRRYRNQRRRLLLLLIQLPAATATTLTVFAVFAVFAALAVHFLILEKRRHQSKHVPVNLPDHQRLGHLEPLPPALHEPRVVVRPPHRPQTRGHPQQFLGRLQQIDRLPHRRIRHRRRHVEWHAPHQLPSLVIKPPQRKVRSQHQLQITPLHVRILSMPIDL